MSEFSQSFRTKSSISAVNIIIAGVTSTSGREIDFIETLTETK